MTKYYTEELRLLLEICIMLLKANRKAISVKELNTICKAHWGVETASALLIKEKLAIGNKIMELIFPQWYYEEFLEEILRNKFVENLRWDEEKDKEGIWLPYYCESEIAKFIKENKYDFIGKDTADDKIICGIGDKSIVLEDEKGEQSFHWFILPKYVVLNPKYKNVFGDGFDRAEEILRLHGDWDKNNHLKYILYSEEYPQSFVCKKEYVKVVKK